MVKMSVLDIKVILWLSSRGPGASPAVQHNDYNRLVHRSAETAQRRDLWTGCLWNTSMYAAHSGHHGGLQNQQ